MTRRIISASRETFGRLFRNVRDVEGAARSATPHQPRYMAWDGGGSISVGKTSADWAKETSATIALYSGTPGSETATGESVSVYNRIGKVLSGKWVLVAKTDDDKWYLVAPELSSVSAVVSAEITSTTVAGVTSSNLTFHRKKFWALTPEDDTDVNIGLAECVPTYSG